MRIDTVVRRGPAPLLLRRCPLAVALLAALLAVGTYAAAAEPSVVRHAGSDRYGTAAAASAATFDPGVDRVFLATGLDHPDALVAGAVAARLGAPLLLTRPGDLPVPTAAELVRLEPTQVTVLGGTSSISTTVEDAVVHDLGFSVDRVAGPDRFGTAAALSSRFVDPGVPVAYVANGLGFADALVGGPAAAAQGGTLLLVRPDTVPSSTATELERLDPGRIVVLGGTSAVSDAVATSLAAFTDGTVERRAGVDRYATAAAVVSDAFDGTADTVLLATGRHFPDALVGGPLAGRLGAPLLTTRPSCVPPAVLEEIDRLAPATLVVLGGTAAVSDAAAGLVSCDDLPSGTPVPRVLTSGLDSPWDVTFTPDGRTFVTERDSGRLYERSADGGLAVAATFSVDAAGEGGLLGLTHSPDFASDGHLFVFLTTSSDNRVVRLDVDTGAQTPILTGIPDATFHDAGRIVFGPDGMLWVGTGDAGVPQRSQDLLSLAGKILRIAPDGSAPDGNPFAGSPIWAVGFRDPQGLAFDADGRLYATEFGPDRDDEINLIVRGGNYAWGSRPGGQSAQPTGVTGDPAFVDPIVVRQPADASWSGASILVGGAIPEWEGDLFVAALRGRRLYRVDLDPATGGVVGVEELLVGAYGRLRHVAQAPDGSLWILTSNCDGRGTCPAAGDRIVRLGPE